ncbi:hypothetical protein K450DRAFT_211996 [Umbelopsis ramanniana AG]|uniref:Phosphate transporter n=1 Tax=Umbelopsis ramanniana AG TaxID=1314678 RepID=A0AAD5E601_UMBRA|nr:uncharacterized protein K450DRAFT_211996 [Umbelopsis ramanniana AG]KAI8578098.1 hypothetical protein K450DRAFT_211996 [Umbelopsis ramanniana AG]
MDFVTIPIHSYTYIFAVGMILAFMDAFGIGANDVANSFASSVGSKTLTLVQACCIAVFTEFLGAFLMGSSTADTIRGNIISLELFANQPGTLMLAMLCAITGAASWVLFACRMGWPVSTTHSVVGAMIGVGVAGFGFGAVDWGWSGVGSIIASWVISPICAGIVTAIILFITQQLVLKSDNSFKRGLIALPFYFFVTLAINVFYIVYKGSPGLNLSKLPLGSVFGITFGISGGIFLFCWFFLKPFLKRRLGDGEPLKWYHVFFIPLVSKREKAEVEAPSIEAPTEHGPDSIQEAPNEKTDESQEDYVATEEENATDNADSKDSRPKQLLKKGLDRFKAKMKKGIEDDTHDEKLQQIHDNAQKYENRTERLFSVLQVMTACFASFAHGSNDVANAVGPISTIYNIWSTGTVESTKAAVPWWILLYGGIGIDVGLVLYGYRTMRTLGHKITYLSPSRGFAVELATAFTVLTCSKLGLPVSTTHCVTGATAAVGLMNKNGWKTLNWRTLGLVFSSWIITLPIAGLLSGLLFAFVGNSPVIIH